MKNTLRRASLYFSAGCIGGLANSLSVWLSGISGFTGLLGVTLMVYLTPSMLYQRMIWGGLWGLLFFLPLKFRSAFYRGVLLSIFPTLVQLFIVFPLKAGKGIAGLELGLMTPVLVFLFNAIWGITASWYRKYIGD